MYSNTVLLARTVWRGRGFGRLCPKTRTLTSNAASSPFEAHDLLHTGLYEGMSRLGLGARVANRTEDVIPVS